MLLLVSLYTYMFKYRIFNFFIIIIKLIIFVYKYNVGNTNCFNIIVKKKKCTIFYNE